MFCTVMKTTITLQEDEQARAAFAQLAEVGAQANGREKHQHEGRLQAALKAQRQARDLMCSEDGGRHQQAARNGLWDVEVTQKVDVPCHELAKQQDQHGHDECVVRAEGHVHKKSPENFTRRLGEPPERRAQTSVRG